MIGAEDIKVVRQWFSTEEVNTQGFDS